MKKFPMNDTENIQDQLFVYWKCVCAAYWKLGLPLKLQSWQVDTNGTAIHPSHLLYFHACGKAFYGICII